MSRDRTPLDDPTLDALLEEANSGNPRQPGGDEHLDDRTLALYLENALEAEAQRDAETHLASCPDCRAEWITARGLVEEFESATPAPSFVDRMRAAWAPVPVPVLGAVVALLLLVTTLVVLPRFGAPDDPFAPFMADEADILRASEAGGVEPLAPRFDLIDTVTPGFEWSRAPGATAYRLLVIDEQEQVVGLLEQALEEAGASFVVEGDRVRLDGYPPDFPALASGGLYAWKVDARIDGMWVASAFVPFRVESGAAPESPGR